MGYHEAVKDRLERAGSVAACLFPPVDEIYQRYNAKFYDSPQYQISRKNANNYLLDLAKENKNKVFPFYFVWNDFVCDGLENYYGVKWHRHPDEPVYDYGSELCEKFLQKVYTLQLPIIFEEELHITKMFVERVNNRTPIIIPHIGMLNGGYERLEVAGIFSNHENVYIDTALGSTSKMERFINKFGSKRIIFGSDYPFGGFDTEKEKIKELHKTGIITRDQLEDIMYKNILRLMHIAQQDVIPQQQ